MAKKENIVRDKSYAFAVRIVKLSRYLQKEKKEYILSKQLMRSGTSPGSLIREADQAESRKDFIHKMSIALKEINETLYWIDLLRDTDYINAHDIVNLKEEAQEIFYILTAIIKSAKIKSNHV